MMRIKKVVRRLIVNLIGIPLLIVGLVLIPLPGPGVVVCFLALLILSLEHDWAQHRREQFRAKIKAIYETAKKRADRVENWDPKRYKK